MVHLEIVHVGLVVSGEKLGVTGRQKRDVIGWVSDPIHNHPKFLSCPRADDVSHSRLCFDL